jgi:hypothetical protein
LIKKEFRIEIACKISPFVITHGILNRLNGRESRRIEDIKFPQIRYEAFLYGLLSAIYLRSLAQEKFQFFFWYWLCIWFMGLELI